MCTYRVLTVRTAFKSLMICMTAAFPLLSTGGVAAAPSLVRSIQEQRQEKLVLQHYDLSCGAAALATLLRYQHGEAVGERRVAIGLIKRKAYIGNPEILRARQGFSLLDMKRYVERLGYSGRAFGNLGFDDLVGLAPAIIPIRLHGYNHFVVFRGALGNNVLVGDPAFGNRTLTMNRFVASWIDYAQFGRVAFTVERRDDLIPPNQLSASTRDFPILTPMPSPPMTP